MAVRGQRWGEPTFCVHKLKFTKMNGAGNDFVLLDNRSGGLVLDAAALARLCERHRGVGADGVLVVERPQTRHADYRMRYYNADGGEAEMCGNGARCFARFAARLAEAGGGGAGRDQEFISFETVAGMIRAQIGGEAVTLDMSEPSEGKDLGELTAAGRSLPRAWFLNTGVPHVVVPVAAVAPVNVRGLGAAIRHHARFAPKGANANFFEVLGPREILLRTYERGVEDETLACGTGATAAALVHAEMNGCEGAGTIAVRVRSGDTLHVGFERTGPFQFPRVTLGGPAEFVFNGEIAV